MDTIDERRSWKERKQKCKYFYCRFLLKISIVEKIDGWMDEEREEDEV
jgi:hypothetical protein